MRNALAPLIGGDPEFFVGRNNELITSKGLLGGHKGDPFDLENGSVQEDNIMLELNLIPSATPQDFIKNINNLLAEVEGRLNALGTHFMTVPEVTMTALVKESKEAYEYGCEPDFNAWTGEVNPAPLLGESDFRFAGGHLHCSLNKKLTREQQNNIIKWFDVTVGLYCVLHDPGLERAKYYGTAGRMRPTKYGKKSMGVEYRVPSNFWMFSQDHAEAMHKLATWALLKGYSTEFNSATVGMDGIELLVQESINNRDVDLANFLLMRMKDLHNLEF